MTKYIGNAPSAVALTSDEITDGIISTAKVAADAIAVASCPVTSKTSTAPSLESETLLE